MKLDLTLKRNSCRFNINQDMIMKKDACVHGQCMLMTRKLTHPAVITYIFQLHKINLIVFRNTRKVINISMNLKIHTACRSQITSKKYININLNVY